MQIAERLDRARFESMVCATRFSAGEREQEMQMRRAMVVGKLGSADAFVIGERAT